VGILGGAAGALFIKASKHWARSFRRIGAIKKFPLLEVALVALTTGAMSYWNVFTHLPVAKLLLNIASPCDSDDPNRNAIGLCPSKIDDIPPVLISLLVAFLIKGFLTTITFGIVSNHHLLHWFMVPGAVENTHSNRSICTESACRYLHAVHGGRRPYGQAHRPHGAVGCLPLP
jgi:hypothetical protein